MEPLSAVSVQALINMLFEIQALINMLFKFQKRVVLSLTCDSVVCLLQHCLMCGLCNAAGAVE